MTEITIPAQRPVGADGLLLHEDDHVAQLALALENLERVLGAAGLAPADLVAITVRTTDRRLFDDAAEVLTQRLVEHGVRPRIAVREVPWLGQAGMTVAVGATARSVETTSHKEEQPMTSELTESPRRAYAAAEALRGLCEGRVYLPGDAGYDQARTPWAVQVDQRPAAVALPRTVSEVSRVVRTAASVGLHVAPQSTGHNAAPLAAQGLERTVLLRTSTMRAVTVDPERRIARIEGGALWQDVVEAAAPHGLAALHGSAPDVGVAGYSLGGGIGWYARRLGMATNSITAVEIVTADGALVRADRRNHPDLFWAVRGGGGSFGVVVAIEMRLYEIEDAYAGMLVWDVSEAERVLTTWADWAVGAPDAVTTSFRMLNVPPLPDVPEPLRGRSIVVIDGAVLGTDEEGERILARLRALGPEIDTFGRVPAPSLTRLHMDPEGPTPFTGETTMLRELTPEAIAAFLATVPTGPGAPLLFAELRQLGGALGRRAEGAGVLPRLDGAFLGFAGGMALTPEMGAAAHAAAEGVVAALAPWSSGSTYLNFAETSADVRSAYPGWSWLQLKGIRSAYDPTGVFVANHRIPRLWEAGRPTA